MYPPIYACSSRQCWCLKAEDEKDGCLIISFLVSQLALVWTLTKHAYLCVFPHILCINDHTYCPSQTKSLCFASLFSNTHLLPMDSLALIHMYAVSLQSQAWSAKIFIQLYHGYYFCTNIIYYMHIISVKGVVVLYLKNLNSLHSFRHSYRNVQTHTHRALILNNLSEFW